MADDAGPTGADAGALDLLRALAEAPPEVRQWLAQHAGVGDSATAHGPPPAADPEAEPAAAVAPARTADDDDHDPAADEDDDDDILARPRAGRSGGSRRGAGGSTRLLILVAVIAGIVLGVWYAGRPAASEPATATPTMGTAASQAEAQARIVELEALLATDPEDVAAHLELGVLLFNAEQMAAAGEHWTTATELAPAEAEAWYNLGFYHVSVDPPDYAAARDCWERVVEIDPESELAAVAGTHLGGLMGEAGDEATGDAPEPSSGPGEG